MAGRAECVGLWMVSLATWSSTSRAQVAERFAVEQRGDFTLIGNTLAQDCALPEEPISGDVGACGADADDSGADVFWSVGEDGAAPIASTAVSSDEAASIAVLGLPDGARVTRAELFWSAQAGGGDREVATLGRGGVALAVLADQTIRTVADDNDYYQSSADVTEFVRELGAGSYRLSGIDAADPVGVEDTALYAGWWMVVFYALDSEPFRHLALYDTFGLVDLDEPIGVTLAGFEVPSSGIDAKLGVVGFDGDSELTGDQLRFGSDLPLGAAAALDTANDFFDGSRRAVSGAPLGVAGDQPRLSGDAGSLSGVDLHLVNVGDTLTAGQTSAEVLATTSSDRFFLAGLAFSVATTSPDLAGSSESVRDLDGPPLRPGDELEYTISVTNSGTGTASFVTLSAALPAQVSYVPGSLVITSGANAGALTDAADADTGEIDGSAGQTVIVRLGEGASASSGGRLGAGESCVVSYRVVLESGASGIVVSQALIGMAPGPGIEDALVTPTDSDLATPGVTPTTIRVSICSTDADCSALTPTCDANGACVCVPSGPELRCDGKDDDCNGAIDEALAGVACEFGEGLCRVEGLTLCAADGGVVCEPDTDAVLPEGCAGESAECGGGVNGQACTPSSAADDGVIGQVPGDVDSTGDTPAPADEMSTGTRGGPVAPALAPREPRPVPGAATTLGGGGGCGLSARPSALGLAPWLGLGLALAQRRRCRAARAR
jgi:clumping factor A